MGVNFFDAILSILMSFCMLFTGFMDYGTSRDSSAVELVKEDKLVFTDAFACGQGVTTDGEYYYTSGSLTAFGMTSISKWDADTMELVLQNDEPIPEVYINNFACDHVGGISYYNGKIYAAVENKAENYPLVITYDAETLELADIYTIPADNLPDGIPWCAVDAENGYLYCSQFNEVEEILAFHLDTMEFSHVIPLSEPLVRIQGGEVYEGVLYLSSDIKNSNEDVVFGVDVFSGETWMVFCRKVPSVAGNEAEGLTVFPMEDGSLIHVLDYDKTVGVYLRHYKMVEAD